MVRRIIAGFFTQVFPPLLVCAAVVVGLEIFVRLRSIPAYELPKPTDVFASMVNDRADLRSALWTTTQAALIGFGNSIVVGIIAAIILSSSRWIRRAFYPYTIFFQTVPIVAIAPMLIIWCDAGLTPVAISAFIVSVFPIIANTLTGLLGTDPALVDLFKLYGAGPIARLWKLRLPAALPSIVTGLRVSAGLAVIGTVVGEFLVGTLGDGEGLGVMIVGAGKMGHTDRVFAAVLVASLLGLAMFAAVNTIGHFMLRRWHASEQ
jgi:NitT/TauT family transport system permease protein